MCSDYLWSVVSWNQLGLMLKEHAINRQSSPSLCCAPTRYVNVPTQLIHTHLSVPLDSAKLFELRRINQPVVYKQTRNTLRTENGLWINKHACALTDRKLARSQRDDSCITSKCIFRIPPRSGRRLLYGLSTPSTLTLAVIFTAKQQ